MSQVAERVAALESKVESIVNNQDKIEDKIDLILENHLHHIELDVQSIKTSLQLYSKVLITTLAIPGVIFIIMQIVKLIKG